MVGGPQYQCACMEVVPVVDCDDCQSHGDKAIWNQEADAVLSRVRKQLAHEVAVVR